MKCCVSCGHPVLAHANLKPGSPVEPSKGTFWWTSKIADQLNWRGLPSRCFVCRWSNDRCNKSEVPVEI